MVCQRLYHEMAPYFVGPISPKLFLDSFLPAEVGHYSDIFKSGSCLSDLKGASDESTLQAIFVCPNSHHSVLLETDPFQFQIVSKGLSSEDESGLDLVDTSHQKDQVNPSKFPFTCQPDCSVYATKSAHKNQLDSSLVEFLIEFKTTSDFDPFVRPVPSESNTVNDAESAHSGRLDSTLVGSPTEFKMTSGFEPFARSKSNTVNTVQNPFMRSSTAGRKVAGQITAYATWILSAQYRTHLFLILILKEYSRIIRWDRGGAVVTAPIFHREGHVLDFLIRFKYANRQARGHDITVEPANEDDKLEARQLEELADATSLLCISIPDDSSQSCEPSRYIIESPCSRPDVPAGRWTRTSIAYDIQRKRRVLLKDSWRVLLDDISPEGDIYSKLHSHSVPNIPYCSRAGNIGNDLYHASRTHEFNGNPTPSSPYSHYHSSLLVPHRHYRLVLDTIGRRLETFNRSWELVNAVYDALLGEFTVCYPFGSVA